MGHNNILSAPLSQTAQATPTFSVRLSRTVKRAMDIGMSLPVVLLVLPPLAVAVRLSHWVQSPGPLFFRQERCGQNQRLFTILKFRTMDAPPDGLPEISDDPTHRIFPIGSLLRATKLDEVPQFVNVLMGTMSVVGPRPHHLEDCQQFAEQVEDYTQRTAVKPGITGLAQYTEYRGDFEWNCVTSRVEKDLTYIRNWTLALDVKLITGTIAVVGGRCAGSMLARVTAPFASTPAPERATLLQMTEPASADKPLVQTTKGDDRKAA